MADVDLTAELEPIRRDLRVSELGGLGSADVPDGDFIPAVLFRHATALFAAVEAVLELADDWDEEAVDLDGLYAAHHVREAISRALNGESHA